MEAKAVENFREYIRANTVHPDPDYGNYITTFKLLSSAKPKKKFHSN